MGPATVRAARRRFWVDNGFGADGGYDEPWQEAHFAGLPYATPNPRVRVEALRVHDIHHVLTGYGTDWRGESEIAGWELGSGGGGRHPYAWFIALFGFVVGLLALPLRTFRAFRAGRSARNLYADPDPTRVLDHPIAEARIDLGVDGQRRSSLVTDAAAFVLAAATTLPLGLLMLAGTPVLILAAMSRCGCPLRRRAIST